MIIVLASRHDASARALVDGLAEHGEAALLTARDLSASGWRLRVPGGPETLVIDGHPEPAERVDGVVVRLAAVTEDELPDILPADRPYVAAEMNSFLQSWLDAIRCPVFNRPVGAYLCGPGWRPEQWTLWAWRLGIPAEPMTRSQLLEEDARPRPTGALETVTVIGARCFGTPEVRLRQAAGQLAAAAGASLLAAHFRNGRFVAADSFPDLSSAELRAGLHAAVAA